MVAAKLARHHDIAANAIDATLSAICWFAAVQHDSTSPLSPDPPQAPSWELADHESWASTLWDENDLASTALVKAMQQIPPTHNSISNDPPKWKATTPTASGSISAT